jgi:hypothetical protein
MTPPDIADLLRCPIDPAREATLTRDRDRICCDRCGTAFPVKNGLPILLADEAEMPDGVSSRRDLPCLRRK